MSLIEKMQSLRSHNDVASRGGGGWGWGVSVPAKAGPNILLLRISLSNSLGVHRNRCRDTWRSEVNHLNFGARLLSWVLVLPRAYFSSEFSAGGSRRYFILF